MTSNIYNKNFKTKGQLYTQWKNRWQKNENRNITWLGKLMLKSKQKELKKVLKNINPSNAIDVGCAMGYTLSTMQEMGILSVGIDISPTAVQICRDKELNAVEKKVEDVKEKYEFVFSDGMLEHFLYFEPIAQHLMRISKKYVAITQTDHNSFTGKTLIYFAEILRGNKNVYEYNYHIQDFVYVFEKNNFELISKKKIFGGVFNFLLFRKIEDSNIYE